MDMDLLNDHLPFPETVQCFQQVFQRLESQHEMGLLAKHHWGGHQEMDRVYLLTSQPGLKIISCLKSRPVTDVDSP